MHLLWPLWLLLLPSAQALSQPLSISVTRAAPDASRLFPTNSKRLARFLMDAEFGEVRPLSGAWVQRSVIEADATGDLFKRLSYYADNPGAIFVAESADGTLCGFADVSVVQWNPKGGPPDFRQPERPVAELPPSAALRLYVANVVVDGHLRRQGVGRRLMKACEGEAAGWLAACQGRGGVSAGAGAGAGSGAGERKDEGEDEDEVWLEVTSTNTAGLAFYERLGYRVDGRGPGTEVVRAGNSFRVVDVQRCRMRKKLPS